MKDIKRFILFFIDQVLLHTVGILLGVTLLIISITVVYWILKGLYYILT